MAHKPAGASDVKVVDSLSRLGHALDQLADTPAPASCGAGAWAQRWRSREHVQPALCSGEARLSPGRRYRLNNWARRWRECVARRYGSGNADRRWPEALALVVLLWLTMTGLILAGLALVGDEPIGPVAAPGQPDRDAIALEAGFDPSAELQAAAEELGDERPQQRSLGKAPQITPRQAAPAQRGCFGTSVQFVDNPARAAQLATSSGKLLFILNVSGDFEDSRFT